MSSHNFLRTFLIAAAVAATPVSRAATLYWDGATPAGAPGGGAGTWDGTTQNWDTAAAADAATAWVSGSDANFANTAGTVTVGDNIIAGALTFNTTGYTLNTSGSFGITVSSIGITGLANQFNGQLNVGAKITGSSALSLAGAGDTSASGGGNANLGIRLTNTANDFVGDVTITAGLVSYSANSVFGNAANKIILNGGGLLDNNVSVNLSRDIQVAAGGGIVRMWNASVATWSGALTGTGTLNRTDMGNLTLSGDLSGFSGSYVHMTGASSAMATSLTGTAASIGGNWTANVGTITVNSTANQTLAGTTSGGFAKSGTGVLTLTNATIAGNWAINAGGGLKVSSASAQAITGLISGAGPFEKAGAGTATLSNASNSFTGNITISAGELQADVTSNSASPTTSSLGNMTTAGRTITVKSGATLRFTKPDAIGNYQYASPVTLVADGGTITRSVNTTTFNSVGNITLRNGGKLVSTNGNAVLATSVGSFALNGSITVDSTDSLQTIGASIEPLSGQTTNNYINLGGTTGTTTFTVNDTPVAVDLSVSALLANRVLNEGTAKIVKQGAGVMELTNASNAYTGGTTITAGTLGFANNALGTSGAVTMNGGTLQWSSGNTQDISSRLTLVNATTATLDTNGNTVTLASAFGGSTSGVLAKVGTGTLNLTGANTYTGGTTVTAGTLAFANSALGTSGAVTMNGGTLQWNSGNTQDISSRLTLVNATTATLDTNGNTVTLASAFGGSTSGVVTKVGNGVLVLSGANTYTGAVNVQTGTVRLGNALGLGTVAGGVTVSSGAVLDLYGQTVGAESVSLSGTGISSGGALINSSASAASLSGTVALVADSSVGGSGALTLSGVISGSSALAKIGAGTLTLSGLGQNTNTGNITISGGKVSVAAASSTAISATPSNSALGNMTVSRSITVDGNGSILEFAAADAMGAFGYQSPVTLVATNDGLISRTSGTFGSIGAVALSEGGILRANTGVSSLIQSISLNGNVTVTGTNKGGTIDFVASSTNNGVHLRSVGSSGTLTFDVANTAATTDLNVTANLLNPVQVNYLGYNATGTTAGILKTGEGRMDLSGSNSFTGGLTVRAGTVVASSATGFGSSGVTVNDGSTGSSNTSLLLNATSASVTVSNAITVANLGTGTSTLGSATTGGSNQAIFSGAITLNRDTTLDGGSTGDRLGFTGGIGGAANVTIAGTNRVVYSGAANTYTGTTTINSGAALQLSDGTSTASSFLADGQDVTVNGTLNLAKGGNSETIAGLNGAGTVGAISGSDTLVVGSGSFSGKLVDSGATLALTKTGTGTLTLTGALNSYTGATSVSNGTLALGTGGALGNTAITVGSGANFTTAAGTTVGGSVTVNSGATMTASGSLSGTLAVAGAATLASGGSVAGTTTISSNATLTANGTLAGVTVNSGGTLRGTGSAGAVTVNAGTANLVAGNGTSGTFSASSLSFQGAGTITIGSLSGYNDATLGSTAAISVSGALTVASQAITLAVTPGALLEGTYKLLSFGSTNATLSSFTLSGLTFSSQSRLSGSLTLGATSLNYTIVGSSPKWTGANDSRFSGGSNWALISNGSATDYQTEDVMLFDDTATRFTVDLSGGDVTPVSLSFENATNNYVLQGSSGSSGTFAKTGAGSVTISNANTFSSSTIGAGSVVLGNASALGSSAITLNGGVLDVGGQSIANNVALSGGSIAGNGSISGIVSGSGGISKSTTGTLTLSGQNTFTGGTTVSNGVLALGHATNTLADAGAVTVSGGELSLGSNSDTVGSVVLSSGSITGDGTLTGTGYDVRSGTISAKLGGASVVLTKTTSGSVTLSGANTYGGGTTLSAGTVVASNNTALGSGSIALNAGTLSVSSSVTLANGVVLGGGALAGAGTLSGIVSGSSTLTKSGSDTLTLSGANTFSGGIDVSAGTLSISGTLGGGTYGSSISTAGTIGFTSASNQTISGVISGAGALAKSGSGTLTLSGGASTLTGDISITGGKVSVTAASATAQGTNPTNSGLGNMTVARTITVDGSGSILEFATADAMGAFGYNSAVTLVAKNGGVITRTTGAFNSIGSLRLEEGGILRAVGGQNATVNSFSINGNVTVSGTNAGGTIEAVAGNNNGIHLRSVGSSGNVTFTVADTSATDDLLVSANLLNPVQVDYFVYNANGTNAGIIKDGAGKMTLTGTNVYKGSTTVNAGTLAYSGSGSSNSSGNYTVASGATLSVTGGASIYKGSHFGSSVITVNSGGLLELKNWSYDSVGAAASLGGLSNVASAIVVDGGTIRVAGTGSSMTTTYGRAVTVNAGGATFEASSNVTWNLADSGDGNPAFVYNNNPSLTFTGAGDGKFDKVFSGTGAITKSGAGKWILSATNTYSGSTAVSGGTLEVGGSGSLGSGSYSGAVTFSNSSALSIATSASQSLSGVLSGAGSVSKSGTGLLTLSNANNAYTGGTSVTNGTLAFASGALGSSGNVAVNGGTLRWSAGNSQDISSRLILANGGSATLDTNSNDVALASGIGSSSSSALTKAGNGKLSLTGANTYTGDTTISGGTLEVGGSGTLGSGSYAGAITNNSALSVATSASQTLSGALSGTGTLAKSGAGTLTLSNGSNSYSGLTTVSNGLLSVSANNALGTTAAGTAVSSGGALRLSNVNYAAAEALSIAGTGVSGGGALVNSGTSTYAGAITATSNATINLGNGTLNATGGLVKNGTVLTITGGGTLNVGTTGISGSSANSDLVVDGSTVNLNAVSTYNGPTFLRNGATLNANVANALPTANGRSAVVMDDSGAGSSTLAIAGASQSIASLTGAASSTVNIASGLTLTVGSGSGSTTYAGLITGLGGLIKDGASTLTLTHANDYSGGTTVSAGTLIIGNLTALGANTVNVTGGVLDLANFAIANTVNVTGAGSLINAAGYSGTVAATADLTLGGGNTNFAGTVTVSTGSTLTLDGNGALGSSGAATINSGAALDLKGSAVGAASLTLAGTGISGAGALVNTSAGTTASQSGTVTLAANTTVGGAGNINLGGTITGSAALTKAGTGTLTISGTGNYTGGTTVSAGTLVVTGSVSGATNVDAGKLVVNGSLTGAVTVDSGATLGGSGAITGDVTISGAHNPGNSPGIQTITGNLEYTNGATVTWELWKNTASNTPTVAFDQIVVNGNLTFGSVGLTLDFGTVAGGSEVDWSASFWDSYHAWTIYDVSGTLNLGGLSIVGATSQTIEGKTTYDAADSTGATLYSSGRIKAGFYLATALNGQDLQLIYRPIPEPSTYGLALGGLALAAAAIRRRRSR